MTNYHFNVLTMNDIRHNITLFYDFLTFNKDILEIKEALLDPVLGSSEPLLIKKNELINKIQDFRKVLGDVTESSEELDCLIHECKNLIAKEKIKHKNTKAHQKKYSR